MKFLLDTNVVFQMRKPQPDRNVMEWLSSASPEALFVSVVTLTELQKGAENLRGRNPKAAASLEAWIDTIEMTDTVLPVSGAVARQWGRLLCGASPKKAVDLLIAATAMVHGLTVATRNVADFDGLPLAVVNPFDNG